MVLANAVELVKVTASKWNEREVPRLSASLAYYTLLSLAPVVVLMIAIYGLAFSRNTAEQELLNQARNIGGYTAANAVQGLFENLHQTNRGVLAAAIAGFLVILSASAVFGELRDALNTIWDAPAVKTCLKEFIRRRIFSFGLVLALGLLLLLSLMLSAVLNIVEAAMASGLPVHSALLGEATNLVLSFLATAGLFALIFKVIPDVPVAWRDVSIGAFATAILFAAGRALLGLYLTRAAVGSAYGAAGSLVAFLVWVYYSAQIFFFGAIFTQVYASRCGSHSRREKFAINM